MKFNTDRELLDACFDGSRVAREEFINRFSKLVYYSIHRAFRIKGLAPGREEVEDLFGDVFLSLFDSDFAKLRSFEGRNGCSLASWIRLIAGRKAVDHLRDRHREKADARPERDSGYAGQSDDETPEERFLNREKERILAEAVTRLPPDDLLFLNLYYEEEHSPERIAEILGVSVGTVYSKKHRLLEKLKKLAEEEKREWPNKS